MYLCGVSLCFGEGLIYEKTPDSDKNKDMIKDAFDKLKKYK